MPRVCWGDVEGCTLNYLPQCTSVTQEVIDISGISVVQTNIRPPTLLSCKVKRQYLLKHILLFWLCRAAIPATNQICSKLSLQENIKENSEHQESLDDPIHTGMVYLHKCSTPFKAFCIISMTYMINLCSSFGKMTLSTTG